MKYEPMLVTVGLNCTALATKNGRKFLKTCGGQNGFAEKNLK
jgi:hypothetical protein